MGRDYAARYSVGRTYSIGGIVYLAYRAEKGKVYLRPRMIEWTSPRYDELQSNWDNIKNKDLIRSEFGGERKQRKKTKPFDIKGL